jgi:hypothetical protein
VKVQLADKAPRGYWGALLSAASEEPERAQGFSLQHVKFQTRRIELEFAEARAEAEEQAGYVVCTPYLHGKTENRYRRQRQRCV